MACGTNKKARGVILITVLWVLILLSLVAGNLSLAGRDFATQTLNTVQGVKGAHAADAGLVWALSKIQRKDQKGWLADGSEHRMDFAEASLRVELYDESGKLDLNAAPTELLDALFVPVVEDDLRRAQLVAAIEDWRDEDDLVRLNGAEIDQYLAAGRESGPANRSFEEVGELLKVLGMDLDIFRQVRHSLTVLTGASTINPTVAPFEVLMTLPDASEQVVLTYIDDRRNAWESDLPLPEPPFGTSVYVDSTDGGRYFTLITEASIEPYTRVRKMVQITRRGQTPIVEPMRLLVDDQLTANGGGDEK